MNHYNQTLLVHVQTRNETPYNYALSARFSETHSLRLDESVVEAFLQVTTQRLEQILYHPEKHLPRHKSLCGNFKVSRMWSLTNLAFLPGQGTPCLQGFVADFQHRRSLKTS